MKKNTHPDFAKCVIRCACGAIIETMSTKGDMRVEICSKCHSFFTGKQKFADVGGRIDKFNRRLNRANAASAKA